MLMKNCVYALIAFPAVITAQQPSFVGPPVRPLGAIEATSKEMFGPTITLRHTPSGVLVNDIANRRLLRFDPQLTAFAVVADTTPATASAYGGRIASLIAYKGDSSLFVDASSQSMLVIDGAGQVARVMALPRSRDAGVLGSAIGNAALDAQGRIVYRAMPTFQFRGGPGGPGGGGGPAAFTPPEIPDSAPILRVDLATRATDTIAYVKIPRRKVDIQRDEATGRMSINMITNPLPTVDEFAVTSDGSVALLRGRDYHIDWIRPNGSAESTPKVPHNWQRMSEEEKTTFLDSLKAARERLIASQPPQAAPQSGSSTTTTTGPDGTSRQQTTMIIGGGAGPAAAMGGGPMGMNGQNVTFVPASELPDYKPPFFNGNARADGDGNIWVLTIPTRAYAGGPVYDVINGKGELVDRVQVPVNRTIVGFGSGGVVYLAQRDGNKTILERARVK
jgi:hypothetical protein